MMKNKKTIISLIAIILMTAGYFLAEPDVTETAAPEKGLTEEYSFRNEQYLDEHFEKHGDEMGYDSAEEYLQGANEVVADESSLHKIETEDGDDLYYRERTNEFVVISGDGYIRTYFCPDAGIDYYNRQ